MDSNGVCGSLGNLQTRRLGSTFLQAMEDAGTLRHTGRAVWIPPKKSNELDDVAVQFCV